MYSAPRMIASVRRLTRRISSAGVVAVSGAFERGDTVVILAPDGASIGKGLSTYSAEDAARILGKQSQEIEQILGFKRRDVLIHRDDMVLE